MKRLFLSLLVMSCSVVSAASMPAFPTAKVTDYETLQSWVHQSPRTVASFTMERTMPSGRILKSRGSFEYRLGQGMMWRTEHPVRNAMVITTSSLKLYDAKGRELRHTDLQGAPSGRLTAAFAQKLDPAFLKQMERGFHITCSVNEERTRLVVGLKARHDSNDLRWMLLVISGGELQQVFYESGRQGITNVVFSKIKHDEQVPETPFRLVP